MKQYSALPNDELIESCVQEAEGGSPSGLNATPAGRFILAVDADRRAALAARAVTLWIKSGFHKAGKVASDLLRANSKDWTCARLVGVVEAAAVLHRGHHRFSHFQWFPHRPLISAIEKAVARESLRPDLRAALERWKTALSPKALSPEQERELGEAERIALDESTERPWAEISTAWQTMERLNQLRTPLTPERKLIERLSALLSCGTERKTGAMPLLRIDASDAVGTVIATDVGRGGRADGPAWAALLNHARTITATTPGEKWSTTAAELAGKIDPDNFAACISDWLNAVGKPARAPVACGEIRDRTLLNDGSVELLKGLAWTIVAAKRPDLAPPLANLAEACFKKIPNKGPRNVKVANAATTALAALADPAAAAQLSRLRLRVKHPSSRATVDKALSTASRKSGLSLDDLAEISVPAFGLDASGVRRVKVGEHKAELRVAGARELELRWFAAGDQPCASVPAAIRSNHAEALKQLKREAKDASIMLAAHVLRLERSYLSGRSWALSMWRQRFLEHPLLGTVARRLIWRFDDSLAIPHAGGLVGVTGRRVSPRNDAVVSLWHPIGSAPDQVIAWRVWLEQHDVMQPFKQAHREIYVLTEAERQTGSYSNRFAAHILRQHQLAALCQERGWEYRLQGDFDSGNAPALHLPTQNIKAEFWVEPAGADVSPRGIFLYVSSDQVRFGRPLQELPPVVFSEVMRDVDLFVSVTSIAGDPAWEDSDAGGRYRGYWEHWTFGDLSVTAQTRRDVLERLLPRLKIAPLCSLSGKFLVVKGRLRTYKIHLGSGNILMEPNDQYLCIVPTRGSALTGVAKVFLPFEGDHTLSVILSKAFLLAQDVGIKDETIMRQIRS